MPGSAGRAHGVARPKAPWHICHVGQHGIVGLLDPLNEIAIAAHTLGCDQSKLRAVAADRGDQHSLLAHQEFARAVQDEHRLPLRALGRHEAHGRASHVR